MTPEDIAAARALCDAATPGPWTECNANRRVDGDPDCSCGLIWGGDGNDTVARSYSAENETHGRAEDWKFIAAARTLLPAALDEIEYLSKKWSAAIDMGHAGESAIAALVAERDQLQAALLRRDAEVNAIEQRMAAIEKARDEIAAMLDDHADWSHETKAAYSRFQALRKVGQ